MPGPIFKGEQAAIAIRVNPIYDADSKLETYEYEYQGSESAIYGLASGFKAAGWSYRITNNDPIYSVFVSQPVTNPDVEDLDRWEISTESVEKSLWDLPDVADYARQYDANLNPGDLTFKAEIEAAIDSKESQTYATGTIPYKLLEHFRAGVTGWQLDLVVLRRFRRISVDLAPNYQLNLDTGLYIYSTGNLNVPATVAFALPATPSDVGTLYTWGWRKRAQKVEIVGQYVEQFIELVFAPWSLLAYSTTNAQVNW